MATKPIRDIERLTPDTKILCLRFLEECKKQGFNIGISETIRTAERQKELIASGASKIARSKHQDGRAFDFYNNQVGNLYPDPIMRKCGAIGKSLGLHWGGDFKNFYDSCHLENNMPVGSVKVTDDKSKHNIIKLKIEVCGIEKQVDAINIGGNNYCKIRDLSVDGKIAIDYKNNTIYINDNPFIPTDSILVNGNNFVKLQSLNNYLKISYDSVRKMPIISV